MSMFDSGHIIIGLINVSIDTNASDFSVLMGLARHPHSKS